MGTAIILAVILGTVITQAATPTTQFWISGGLYPGANAFTFWKEGSNYFSKSNYGSIAYSGSNFTDVFLDTQTAASDGDTFFFARAAYQVNNMTTINKRLLLRGEGIYATTFYSTVDIPAIFHVNTTYVTFDNLRIDGYGDVDPDCGLMINASRCTLRNVMVISFPSQTGVKIFSWLVEFQTCTIQNCLIGVECANNSANSVIFYGGSFYTNRPDAILLLISGGDTLAVYGTDFEGLQASTTAVYINKTTGAKTRSRWIGARFETLMTAFNYSGGASQGEDSFYGCSFATSVTNIFDGKPIDSYVWDNFGFITKARNTVEASNDDWVPFNVTLAGTPQIILLTVQEVDARYIAQVKAANTTHFQLYLYDETAGAAETTDKTISYYAEYEPT